jgi:hypothetical protein
MNDLKVFKYPAGSVYETTLHYITSLMNVLPSLEHFKGESRKTLITSIINEFTVPNNYYQRLVVPSVTQKTVSNFSALMLKGLFELNPNIPRRPFVFVKNELGHQAHDGLIPINTAVYEIDQSELNRGYNYFEDTQVQRRWFNWPSTINSDTIEKCVGSIEAYEDSCGEADDYSFTFYQVSTLAYHGEIDDGSTVFVYIDR